MTAAQIARTHLGYDRVKQTLGRDCYHTASRCVYLSQQTFEGSGIDDVARAMHEVGHAIQHAERPMLFALRNFWPARLWLETDAWNQAVYLMEELPQFSGIDVKQQVKLLRKTCLKTYRSIKVLTF